MKSPMKIEHVEKSHIQSRRTIYLSVLYEYKHEAQNVTIWVFGTSDQGGKEVPTQKWHKWEKWANKIKKKEL